MIVPNNNLSVLPFYTSIEQQNARKWWVYGRVFPLFVPAGYIPPFQIVRTPGGGPVISSIVLYRADGTRVEDLTSAMMYGLHQVRFNGYDVIVWQSQTPIIPNILNGQYYLVYNGDVVRYSEIFTVVNDIQPYIKLEWWDIEDFVMDGCRIVYKYANNTQFKNVLYIPGDIAKPEYIFEEEGVDRDGYFFPIKQISEKRFRFSFLAPEYMLDVMRFVRMSDFVYISKNGQQWAADTFVMTPEWEDWGDVAAVNVEFDTDTVAKKIGRGYIQQTGAGDFNNDFNNDYKNKQ